MVDTPKAGPPPAANPDELVGDYRRALAKNYIGRWDIQDPATGAYFDAVVTIASVQRYPCKDHPCPAHILRKKQRQAEKLGRPMKPEFVIAFAGKRKGWIVRAEAMASIAAAAGTTIARDWVGKKIALHFDPSIQFGREKVGGIRAVGPHGKARETALEAPPNEEVITALEHAFDTEDFRT